MSAEGLVWAGRARRERSGDGLTRHEGELHGRGEQPLLGAVIVMHKRRVDAGRSRDRADRRAVVAILGELAARGFEDRLAGTAVSGPPTGPRGFGHAGTAPAASRVGC